MAYENKSNKSFMALKIDMSEAYDREKWKYLNKIMQKMRFNDKWNNWIMEYISSVTYKILINGSPSE